MDSTPLVCITGQVRVDLIGTDAFQEIDATGITMPIVKHSWLVQDVEELPRRDEGRVPRRAAPGGRAQCSSTSPRTCRRPSSTSSTPTMSICPGGSRRTKVHPRQLQEAAQAIAVAQRPIVYAGGGVLNADACAELLELVELGAASRSRDADGQGRPARTRTR